MSNLIETFTGLEDRASVLAEILRQGPAAPGVTLVGLVDRATLRVEAVRSLPTPEPLLDKEQCFDGRHILRLNDTLRELALEAAPPRTWTGTRWSEVTGELVTVVCRDGTPAITATETQFYWGWRFSNHLTAALDGEVFVVTPQGWASLIGDWSGALPALPIAAEQTGASSAVRDAERLLAGLSAGLLGPRPGECLLCYVVRMVEEYGCDCRLRFASHYRDVRAPRATGLERRLGQVGGYCDCEILLNGFDLRPQHWVPDPTAPDDPTYVTEMTWPDPLPACTGVRLGSTQPCSLWSRRRRPHW